MTYSSMGGTAIPATGGASARAPKESLFALLDREGVEADLATFFGPRAHRFQKLCERMRRKPVRKRRGTLSWSWPVFFLSSLWFFYRKQFLTGALLLLVCFLAGVLAEYTGAQAAANGAAAGVWMYAVLRAKPDYVQAGLKRIAKADELGLAGAERDDYLRRAGGTSWLAGGIAGLLFLAALAVTVLAALAAEGVIGPA